MSNLSYPAAWRCSVRPDIDSTARGRKSHRQFDVGSAGYLHVLRARHGSRSLMAQAKVARLAPTARHSTSARWDLLLSAASLGLLGILFYRNVSIGPDRWGHTDFQLFYGAAVSLLHGSDPYNSAINFINSYTPKVWSSAFETKSYLYAPGFALLIAPLTLLGQFGALVVWDVLSVGFLLGAIYAALKAGGIEATRSRVLVIAAIASLSAAVRKEAFLGQTDVFLMLLICMALWSRQSKRPGAAGLLLGVAIMTKPALGLLLPFLIWKREYRFAIVALVTGAVLFLAPFVWLGTNIWNDQVTVWRFWSNQFLAFAHNDSPKGVLTRLFTVNAVVHPLFVAPWLVTVGWLAISSIVSVVTFSAISRAPLRKDLKTLLEMGLVIEAVFLISPLTEWPYVLYLLVPLIGCYGWLVTVGAARSPRRLLEPGPIRRVAIALVVITVLLIGPANGVEYFFVGQMRSHTHVALYVVLAAANLYVIVAAFALQLYVIRQVVRRPSLAVASTTLNRVEAMRLSTPDIA